MPKYLAEVQIRHAVEQLGRSSARGRMCEFLVGLRALKLVGQEQVPLAESVPEFIQALEEFTLWDPAKVGNPYFNPFGGQADFKSPKFRSNGPSNTMHGWATQANSPYEILNTRPKSIKRRPLSAKQLQAFLIHSGKESDRPRLIDAAVWFYRTVDLEASAGAVPDRPALEAKFISDVGLSEKEVEALFRLEDEDTDADKIAPSEEPLVPKEADPGQDTA